MNFASFAFLGLFALVVAIRLTLGRRGVEPAWLGTLLASSLLFYAWHVPAYLPLLLASAAMDYVAGRAIAALPQGDRRRRLWLLASLVLNLGLLGCFKYADFGLAESERLLRVLGISDPALPRFDWLLPIGISFYTFQSMSYTIDIYRGVLAPERRFWIFLLYVSFFPQLVAGPIVRAGDFLYQVDRPRRLHLESFTEGAYLLVRGLFLKMVCADNLGIQVDVVFAQQGAGEANATALAIAALLFSCQIFCDFAGYSSIARGLGYWLGFRLPVNFRNPYLAGSFNEFWQRWHITLSAWIRDYVYIPLGGSRGSAPRTYVNLLLAMGLCGLWHGAALPFVAWGLLHGFAVAVERAIGLDRGGRRALSGAGRLAWGVVVQLTVLAGWIVFRSETLGQATGIFEALATGPWSAPSADALYALLFTLPVLALHAREALAGRLGETRRSERALIAGAMLAAVLTLYGRTNEFIYFQF